MEIPPVAGEVICGWNSQGTIESQRRAEWETMQRAAEDAARQMEADEAAKRAAEDGARRFRESPWPGLDLRSGQS